MKIGFFGGTFNPIHHGHLIVARDAVEHLGLDRLYFIPAAVSPHKLDTPLPPPELRAQMVEAAIGDEPRFDIETYEVERPGVPSYAIDTILAMRERFGTDARFFYLIGRDNVPLLNTWRRIDDLHRVVEFVVFNRGGEGEAFAPLPYVTLERRIDLSATEIRNRVANRQSIRYLVPEGVRELIAQHSLYQS